MLHPYEITKLIKDIPTREICEATGLTHPTVARIKSGSHTVTLQNYEKVSEFLKVRGVV